MGAELRQREGRGGGRRQRLWESERPPADSWNIVGQSVLKCWYSYLEVKSDVLVCERQGEGGGEGGTESRQQASARPKAVSA
jgi:hypothetical protein